MGSVGCCRVCRHHSHLIVCARSCSIRGFGDSMVDRTAEFLLLHGGHRLPNDSAASATDCSAAHAFPQHSAAHTAAHTATNPATHPAHIAAAPATQPPAPADPYNCEDGFANWQAGWSVPKKEWCCRVHGKGCPNQGGGGCVSPIATSPPYDCDAGFANWMAGWSVAKKAWCCSNRGKGCPPAAGGCA